MLVRALVLTMKQVLNWWWSLFFITICFGDLFWSAGTRQPTQPCGLSHVVPLNMVLGDLRGLIIKYPFARWVL
jgi:hypothetical protein